MIKISKADSYRCCCVCHHKTNVYCITFRSDVTNCGTEIAICEKCFWRMKVTWDRVRREEE